jgi:hypothetical protein
MERVSPTERIRADIDDLFATEGDLGVSLEQVARLVARLLLQSPPGCSGPGSPRPTPWSLS